MDLGSENVEKNSSISRYRIVHAPTLSPGDLMERRGLTPQGQLFILAERHKLISI